MSRGELDPVWLDAPGVVSARIADVKLGTAIEIAIKNLASNEITRETATVFSVPAPCEFKPAPGGTSSACLPPTYRVLTTSDTAPGPPKNSPFEISPETILRIVPVLTAPPTPVVTLPVPSSPAPAPSSSDGWGIIMRADVDPSWLEPAPDPSLLKVGNEIEIAVQNLASSVITRETARILMGPVFSPIYSVATITDTPPGPPMNTPFSIPEEAVLRMVSVTA